MSGERDDELPVLATGDDGELDELDEYLFHFGPWLEHKRPRSVEARRHLAACLNEIRSWRGPGFIPPISDAEYLIAHRKLKRALIANEDAARPIREAWFLWRAKTTGSIQ